VSDRGAGADLEKSERDARPSSPWREKRRDQHKCRFEIGETMTDDEQDDEHGLTEEEEEELDQLISLEELGLVVDELKQREFDRRLYWLIEQAIRDHPEEKLIRERCVGTNLVPDQDRPAGWLVVKVRDAVTGTWLPIARFDVKTLLDDE
jgi:hypothetical protein